MAASFWEVCLSPMKLSTYQSFFPTNGHLPRKFRQRSLLKTITRTFLLSHDFISPVRYSVTRTYITSEVLVTANGTFPNKSRWKSVEDPYCDFLFIWEFQFFIRLTDPHPSKIPGEVTSLSPTSGHLFRSLFINPFREKDLVKEETKARSLVYDPNHG
jgi:hypothetical protein